VQRVLFTKWNILSLGGTIAKEKEDLRKVSSLRAFSLARKSGLEPDEREGRRAFKRGKEQTD